MEGEEPLQVMPDEVNEDELLESPNQQNHDQEANIGGQLNQYAQLGFVQVMEPLIDPVLGSLSPTLSQGQKLPTDLYRAWAQHFAPGPGSSKINILAEWAAFCTAALLNLGSF
ncbi:unnamed protein product [Urochloa humidicola]